MADREIEILTKLITDVSDTSDSDVENAAEARPKIIEIKLARLIAVQSLYHFEILKSLESTFQLASDMVDTWKENKYFKFPGSRVCRDSLRKLLKVTLDNLESIDSNISANLQDDWKLDRIPKVVLAILRVAIGELYCKELDHPIIIDEYLNIADYMNHKGEKGFVNHVLDHVAKGLK